MTVEAKSRTYTCPVCHKERNVFLWLRETEAGYARCDDCGICFTEWKNINQLSTSRKDIRGVYYFPLGNSPKIEYGASYYLPQIDLWIEKNGEDKTKLLDIGFGHPAVLDIGKQLGYETHGIDINRHPSDKESPHNIAIGNFEDLEPSEKFIPPDIIWASHIFEHFKDPRGALAKCYDWLNRQGFIYIAMPDLSFVPKDKIEDWGQWNTIEHHILWDMGKWVEQMKIAGFRVIMAKHNDDASFSSWNDYQIIGKKVSK